MQTLGNRAIDAAAEIGRRLCRTAIEQTDGCTWLAYDSNRVRSGAGQPRQPAGASLYKGTSGIALFLMELFQATGDKKFLAISGAALRHSIAAMHREKVTILSAYTGQIGVAYVAARAFAITRSEEWRTAAARVVASIESGKGARNRLDGDLLSGLAGAICALLQIGRLLDLFDGQQTAIALGEMLIAIAVRRPSGLSWRGARYTCRRDLTGLAHGASGCGAALLALYSITGKHEFRAAAEDAFQYEDAQFDPGVGNWPDHREPIMPARSSGMLPSATLRAYLRRADQDEAKQIRHYTSWCNGAPGIGVARALGFKVLGYEKYRDFALAAARTTIPSLRHPTAGQSLCHGTIGNAECVSLIAAAVDAADCHTAVAEAVECALDCHTGGEPWRSGAIDGLPDPSLFLGEAGIGLALLRVASPGTPSVAIAGCQIHELLHREPSGDDIAQVVESRRQHVRAFFGLSLAAEELVTNDNASLATASLVEPNVERLLVVRQQLNVSAERDRTALLRDALILEAALFDAEAAECNEVLQRLRADARTDAPPELAPGAVLELAPTVRLVTQQFDWQSWLKVRSRNSRPSHITHRFVVFNDCGRAGLLSVDELGAAVVTCLVAPMTVAALTVAIEGVFRGTFGDVTRPARLGEIVIDFYQRGIVDVRAHPQH